MQAGVNKRQQRKLMKSRLCSCKQCTKDLGRFVGEAGTTEKKNERLLYLSIMHYNKVWKLPLCFAALWCLGPWGEAELFFNLELCMIAVIDANSMNPWDKLFKIINNDSRLGGKAGVCSFLIISMYYLWPDLTSQVWFEIHWAELRPIRDVIQSASASALYSKKGPNGQRKLF